MNLGAWTRSVDKSVKEHFALKGSRFGAVLSVLLAAEERASCFVITWVLSSFRMLLWFGLQSVSVAFSGHTHFFKSGIASTCFRDKIPYKNSQM